MGKDQFYNKEWLNIKKYDTEEVRNAIKTHYNKEMMDALEQTMHPWILYLSGEKDKIDFDFRNAIERFINKEHPESASFYKINSIANTHGYNGNGADWGVGVYPVENEELFTFTGETVPKGTLIVNPVLNWF